jgi:Fe2+ or Zn2+ uptake regulation protein
MDDEKVEEICKECGPTFQAFLEQMAAHNKEQMAELGAHPNFICPTCGKIHEYPDEKATRVASSRAS